MVERTEEAERLREQILGLVGSYHEVAFPGEEFVAGKTPVPVSGKVFDGRDLSYLVDASLDFWLTTGRFNEQFERDFAEFIGVRQALTCNSGSSANLLALSTLTSPKLGDRALQAGQEVITTAAGFPTTVNPIIQNGLVPVFVDVQPGTYDADPEAVADAVGPDTGAIMMAHTLGNPFDLDAVTEAADEHGLWLIEDNCDAVGSTYQGQMTGSFGDLATVSFYPAHHITMGEGGCVLTKRPFLKKIIESFRDWGRDCWCDPGKDNTCGKRFGWELGDLPFGYDHKYIYSHVGYNLKITDMQAAVGLAQLDKLPGFIEARRENWQRLYDGLNDLDGYFIMPRTTEGSEPSWFGFALTVRPDAPFGRRDIVEFLEARQIATRQLFAGNLVKQPAYRDVTYRVAGDLSNSDLVMNATFWIGCYPGLTEPMLDYIIESFHDFVRSTSTLASSA